MIDWLRLSFIVFAIGGHFAVMLAAYNRLNALGIDRKIIKRFTKVMFAFTLALPLWFCIFHGEVAMNWLTNPSAEPIGKGWQLYGLLAIVLSILMLGPFVLTRPLFGWNWVRVNRNATVDRSFRDAENLPAVSKRCRWMASVPGNQMFDLSVEQIELPIHGLSQTLDGYRIAHLSDVHLTGHVDPAFHRKAVEHAMAFEPEMMALTGDIIDKARCIPWLNSIFGGVNCPDGQYFILGNHDTRIDDPSETRRAMTGLGWIDLGVETVCMKPRETPVRLMGSEHPWFPRNVTDFHQTESENPPLPRWLLAHSPDEIEWARQNGVQLMLAGHTHGGQGRLPLLGPLLSPSRYGSRFASGDFYLPPTTMHVTRGLSGTHLLRINCRPEVSLLTLRRA